MEYPEVVRIYATVQEPDYDAPWQAQTPTSTTGSGVLIGVGEVLTGAHVIAGATFLQVQEASRPDKVVARVKAVCHDADLALLQIDDPDFAKGVRPARLDELANPRDRVAVVGYPVGGDELSITEGVVSRVETQRYAHSQRHLLAVTIDAAINAGNSGGPVFRDQRVAGIAFQTLTDAENIGEMVAAPIIARFLAGVSQGRELDQPGLGIQTQTLENPLLRSHAGLGKKDSGLLVTQVEYQNSSYGVLEPGDVLLSIDGHDIANNGTVRYQDRFRARFDVVLGTHFVGENLPIRFARGEERHETSLKLLPRKFLVPRSRYDHTPSYFVYGGCVFQPLSRDYLATWKTWWQTAPKELLNAYYYGLLTPERQEIVVLAQILADDINVGYESLYWEPVLDVNGAMPVDLADFARMVDAASGRVEIRVSSQGRLVFDVNAVREANPRVMERYRIPFDRSKDLATSTSPRANDHTHSPS